MQPGFDFWQVSGIKYKITILITGAVVGSATVIKTKTLNIVNLVKIPLPQKSWVIDEMEILPTARGKGYGTALLQYLITATQEIEQLPIVLMPPKSEYTSRILSWYKRHGFYPQPQRYWQRDIDQIITNS